MNSLLNLKVAVFSLLLFLSPLNAISQNFVISNDAVIDSRTANKIEEIGNEVKSKTNVNIYVYAKSTFGIEKNISRKEKNKLIKKYESDIIKKLNKPYVILTMSLEEMHVNLLTSETIKKHIDKNEILDDYVVPLLASKDKNSLFAKASAAVLNGYDEIADQIARANGIEKLEAGIPDSGKVAGTIWKVLIYSLLLVGIILYTYAVLKSRKK